MKLHELHEAVRKEKTVADLKIKYTGNDFRCGNYELTSLEGSPGKVGGGFYCDNNKLTSLEGSPGKVGGDFYCGNNKLTSLKGAPKEVSGGFYCDFNKLTSLEGSPSKVSGDFHCDYNKLTSLKGAPKEIDGNFRCDHNKLTSLEGIHLQINRINGYAIFSVNPIKSHVLGLLLIDGLKKVWFENLELETIINKYLKGSRDVIDCQNELMDNKLEAFAQL